MSGDTRPLLSRCRVFGVLVAGVCATVVGEQRQNSTQFRSGITLVPITVHAVDREGRAVTDLTAADFVITEAGQPQEIAHFQAIDATADVPAGGRTFFIVLGRGRLNRPVKALDGLIDFVTNLEARDRVGLLAYLRVVDPTTDHARVVEFLRRYRDQHEQIEGLLQADMRFYLIGPSPTLGKATKAAIDKLFPAGLMDREFAGSTGDAIGHFNDWRFLQKSFDFLRSVQGEKHAVLISANTQGFFRVDDDPMKNYWVRVAADTRASLSFIHAAGQEPPLMVKGELKITRYTGLDPAVITDHAILAWQTGGVSAFYRYAEQPLAALDRATRFHYVVGYYPTRQASADQYRRVEVQVTRPGVRLLYRQGYVATPPVLQPVELREALTETRLEHAAVRLVIAEPKSFRMPDGWQVRLRNPVWVASQSGGSLRIDIAFDARPAWIAKEGDHYVTDFDLLLLADDAGRNVLAQRRQKVNLRLNHAEFARTRNEWLNYETTLDVPSRPAFLRVVLYDYENDRTASTQIRLTPVQKPPAPRALNMKGIEGVEGQSRKLHCPSQPSLLFTLKSSLSAGRASDLRSEVFDRRRQPFLERHLRLPPQQRPRAGDVGLAHLRIVGRERSEDQLAR
jgi:hypothetical protein